MTPMEQSILNELHHQPGITYQELIARITTGNLHEKDYERGIYMAVNRLIVGGMITYSHNPRGELVLSDTGKIEQSRLVWQKS